MPTFPAGGVPTTNVDDAVNDRAPDAMADIKTLIEQFDLLVAYFSTVGKALASATDEAAGRTALLLGNAATKNVGTGADDVAVGNHTHGGLQSSSAAVNALAAQTPAADRLFYFTSDSAGALAVLSAYVRGLLSSVDEAALHNSMGLGAAAKKAVGSVGGVQAYSAVLALLAGLTAATNKGIRFTGSGTIETFDLSNKALTLLDDADEAAMRTTLQLGAAAQKAVDAAGGVQSYDLVLAYLSALTPAAGTLPYFDTVSSAALATLTDYMLGALAQPTPTAIQSYFGIDTSVYVDWQDASAAFLTPEEADVWYAPNVQAFETPGGFSYIVPERVKLYYVEIDGATGGGGSGRRGANGTNRFGGGAAAQPGAFRGFLPADFFGPPGTVVSGTIGSPGIGGAAVTTDNTDGNDGTDATDTLVGSVLKAIGSKGGKKGTATSGLGGAKNFQAIGHGMGTSCQDSAQGGDAGTAQGANTAGAPYTIPQNNGLVRTASGSGGCLTSANVAHPGQNGQGIYNNTIQNHPNNGATGGAANGSPGQDGPTIDLGANRKVDLGGAGGGAATAAAGGNGGFPGGGGGPSANSFASGKGANGRPGRVVITALRGGMT
jgi:hypothetical protein